MKLVLPYVILNKFNKFLVPVVCICKSCTYFFQLFFIFFFGYRCGFNDNDACQSWFLRIMGKLNAPKQLNEFFAFTFHAWCQDPNSGSVESENCYQLCQKGKLCIVLQKWISIDKGVNFEDNWSLN